METHEFLKRRAIPGCGEQKKELMAQHQALCSLIFQQITTCFNCEPSPELIKARKERDQIEKLLLEITK
ncbi:hypothetical protein Asfd1_55 [Aeromonas phage Asfd_1]|nr:hypothetical protein Asfd1_55 [Aeromonas phage Asfd_1]